MTSPAQTTVTLPSDCDSAGADEVLGALRKCVAEAASGKPLAVELTAGRPTAIALQLAASAALSLTRRDAFAGYGPTAAPILSHATDL